MHCLSVNARTQEMLALHRENFKRCWCISGARILPADQTWQLCKTNPRASFKNFKSRVFPSRLMWHFTIMQNFAWAQLWSLFAPFKFQSTTHQRPRASISTGPTTSSQTVTAATTVRFYTDVTWGVQIICKPSAGRPFKTQLRLPPAPPSAPRSGTPGRS